jgi:Pyridoxal-phosphate dependent enzyme
VSLSDFPRYPLMFGPSPVHPLERLTAHLGGAQIWAKREDCNSGLAFGGNKVRKLEYLVPDALAQGADTLVSIGGVQSNHTPRPQCLQRPVPLALFATPSASPVPARRALRRLAPCRDVRLGWDAEPGMQGAPETVGWPRGL